MPPEAALTCAQKVSRGRSDAIAATGRICTTTLTTHHVEHRVTARRGNAEDREEDQPDASSHRLSCVSSDLGGGDSGLCVIERVVGLSHDWRVSPASGATELELAKAEMLRKTRLLPELF